MARSECCDARAHSDGRGTRYCSVCHRKYRVGDELAPWRVAELVAMQCPDWDEEEQDLCTPELRLWMSVVRRAILDLRFLSYPEPHRSKTLFGVELSRKRAQWKRGQELAMEAKQALLGAGCGPYYEVLGLDPEWVRRIVFRCVSRLRGVPASVVARAQSVPVADPVAAYIADLRRRKANLRAEVPG